MKKIGITILFVIISCMVSFADKNLKVLNIYSKGDLTAIPLAGIDSINHSFYDSDSILHSEYISSLIYTIDRDYQMPISSIDSIMIGEINLYEFEENIYDISDYLSSQTELDIEVFQNNLINWLNSNEVIQKVTINESKDIITCKLKNGLLFHFSFEDISFFGDRIEQTLIQKRGAVNNDDKFHNISEQQDEKIIESNKILFIQCMDMLLSNAKEEIADLKDIIYYSPVNYVGSSFEKDCLFLDEDFSKYGLIIITQTHGAGNYKGSFKCQDIYAANSGSDFCSINYNRGWQVYFDKDEIVKVLDEPYFWITPKVMYYKLIDSDAIVYANYCWSSGLNNWLSKKNTFFGYYTRSMYRDNKNYLVSFFGNMANGYTYKDAIQPLKSYLGYDIIAGDFWTVYPFTNNPNSKQRYFSIRTDSIVRVSDNGNPIITGNINGYKNLKDVIKYTVYVHEGTDDFLPTDDGVKSVTGNIIDDEGTFEYEYNKSLDLGSTYGFKIGFKYSNTSLNS